MSQSQVDDGVNNSQVSFYTGQDVKETLSMESDRYKPVPHCYHLWEITGGAAIEEGSPQAPHQLHGSHVVGEGVGVACRSEGALPPPSLVTLIKDEDGEWEEEKGSGDVEGSADCKTDCGVMAMEY